MKFAEKELYQKLMKLYGSPLYFYDEARLRKSCENMKDFQDFLSERLGVKVNMHYSTKSNSNVEILRIVKKIGLCVDCMSPVEYALDSYAEFDKKDMLYVCNNISEEEMKFVHAEDVLICLDSISQVETWGKTFPGTEIMVRINPGTKGVGHSDKVITSGNATKFGISEENLPELFEVAKKHNLTIIGTHQHLGSLFLNDKIDEYLNGVKSGLRIVEQYFENVKIVDLGGGFGVPYKPEEQPLDLGVLAEKLILILKDFLKKCPHVKEFKFEPGRYIPCEAGVLLGTVTATKHENGINWIGCDIGMNQLVRPSMYDSYHEVEIMNSSSKEKYIKANVCGNVCESGDILAKDRLLLEAEVGDIVLVKNAGAYGYSMASNYTGRLKPAEVMLTENGEIRLIRQRESIADINMLLTGL